MKSPGGGKYQKYIVFKLNLDQNLENFYLKTFKKKKRREVRKVFSLNETTLNGFMD